MTQAIRRGLLMAFYPATYTADVLILEAGNTYLQGIPAATHLDGTSAQSGAFCAVLLFDEQNINDAVVLAIFPNGSGGVPSPTPGRIVCIAPTQQLLNYNIAPGATATFNLTGGNIPANALAVLLNAYFTCSSAASYINIAPHGASIDSYMSIGNIAVANEYLNGFGIMPLVSGEIDIKANVGTCTVTLYTYGYII